jgi:hypothetical protein
MEPIIIMMPLRTLVIFAPLFQLFLRFLYITIHPPFLHLDFNCHKDYTRMEVLLKILRTPQSIIVLITKFEHY